MKITALTDSQVSKFPAIVDHFVAKGLDTSPLDKKKATKAVKLAYTCAGLTPPTDIRFLASPYEGALLVKKLLNMTDGFCYPFFGSFDASWLSFYAAFKMFGLKEETKQMEGLFACMEHCGWVWFLDEACIVTEKPTSICRDNAGRLHNLTGPAIAYSDGYSQYYVHGVSVPDDFIKNPKSITVERINGETNAELRRVMLEIFGIKKYIKKSGSQQVDKNKLGTLYRMSVGSEDMAFLRLVNSTPEKDGTKKEYFMPVPPETVRVKQGLAWMAGMKEEDYNPEVET